MAWRSSSSLIRGRWSGTTPTHSGSPGGAFAAAPWSSTGTPCIRRAWRRRCSRRARRGLPPGGGARGHLAPRSGLVLRGRVRRVPRAWRRGARRAGRRRGLGRGGRPCGPEPGQADRRPLLVSRQAAPAWRERRIMPLLARMLAAPLVIDVRPGAIGGLGELLCDRRIATEGRVAIAVGPGQGDSIARELGGVARQVFRLGEASYDGAVALGRQLRAGGFEAVAGIGGGKTIDVTKYAAHMAGIPMVSVPTSLAHDGIASPVSTLRHESGTGSYGV